MVPIILHREFSIDQTGDIGWQQLNIPSNCKYMRTIAMREALREAMQEEMRLDDRVYLMGEEVAEYNGA